MLTSARTVIQKLPVPSNNIIAIHLTIDNQHFSLFNIYNDCTHNYTLDTLASYLTNNIQVVLPHLEDYML